MSSSSKDETKRLLFSRRRWLLACGLALGTVGLNGCGNFQDDLPTVANPTAPPSATPNPVTIIKAATANVPTVAPTPTANPNAVLVQITASKSLYPISPYIYGLNATDDSSDYLKGIKPGLLRWGGNPSTRYNWVIGNAWNAGRDWDFHNTNYGNSGGNVADNSVASNQKDGLATLITIPTIGWVAKNSDQNVQSQNVPKHGGPPLQPGGDAISGYDPTANRALTMISR